MPGLTPAVVEREPVQVMFLRAPDEVDKFAPLFGVIEERVGLRGRKYFGAFFVQANEYWVCVATQSGDDAAGLGLETGMLSGGRFLRGRLRGEAPAVYEQIAPTFATLATLAAVDADRPGIEFYRAHGEIDCLLPILP